MTKILLVDNNATQLETLKNPLEQDDHTVLLANGQKALKTVWREAPDVVLLNLLLSDSDGFEICRRMREIGVPFILVTGHQIEERAIIRALEMGADDYLRSPILPSVLRVKIRSLVRRNNNFTAGKHPIYDDGHLFIDLETRLVRLGDEVIKLTPTEFRLLSVLLRKADRVVTHEELIKEIWGTEKDTSLGSLKLYVHYLRQKLEAAPRNPRYLVAEWGVGYRFQSIEIEQTA